LSAADRAYFEPRLGHDIGAVRIHADAGARAFSRGLGARALTVGTDIFCRDGMPTADDASGRELLAHELAHVVQHRGHGHATALPGGLPVDRADSPAEREAAAAGDLVARGGTARHLSAVPAPVASRWTDERADVEDFQRSHPAVAHASSGEITDADVRAMDTSARFLQAVTRAHLAEQFGDRVNELLTDESIAMMTGFLAATVFLQWTPAGWLADVVLAGVTVVSVILLQKEASAVIEELMAFCDKAANANSVADLDEAGQHFATAATKVTIDVVLGLLLHRVSKATAPAAAPRPGAPSIVVTRSGTTTAPATTGEPVTGPMPERLRAGIISQGPPTRVVGDVIDGEQVVRKTVAAGTPVGWTRFGKLWGAESIRAQEAALIKLENAGIDTARIRQSFSDTGELILDYAGQSVYDQWSTMSSQAREAYYAYVAAAKDVLGVFHDLKTRNIAYQQLEVDGQVVHRFVAFDPAFDRYTLIVAVVGGVGLAIIPGMIGSIATYQAVEAIRNR